MTATSKLLAKSVALALSLSASMAWASHHTAIAVSTPGRAIVGQTSGGSSRRESDEMLKRARQAIKSGDYQLAEWYVDRAEQSGVNYNSLLNRIGDSPQKVRRDLARLRGEHDAAMPPSRQFPLPPVSRSDPDAGRRGNPFHPQEGTIPLGPVTNRNKRTARSYLEKGRAALSRGDTTSAIGWYHSVLSTRAAFTPGEYSPEDLAAELRGAGVDATRLLPASGPGPGPTQLTPDHVDGLGPQIPPALDQATGRGGPGLQGQVITNPFVGSPPLTASAGPSRPLGPAPGSRPDPRKAEVLRLLAMSQAALNRGELDQAERYARSADEKNLPDEQYGPDDPRPWMLLLKISRERRRHAQRSPVEPAPAPRPPLAPPDARPEPVSWEDNHRLPAPSGPVTTQPRELDTGPAPRMTQLIPTSPAPAGEDGMQLFLRGEQALRERDLEGAHQLFKQAWARQDDLDEGTRQRLQDHLQMASRAGIGSGELSPSPQAELDETQRHLIQMLMSEVSREQGAIDRRRETDPKGAWDQLRQLRDRVAEEDIDPASRDQLLVRIDRQIAELERFIDHNRARIELDEHNRQVLADVERHRQQKLQIQQKLADLVEQFNTLMEQQRYPEAIVVAKQAREIDPLNPVVQNMVWKGTFARQFASSMARRERSHEGALASFNSVDESAVPFDDRIAIEFPDAQMWSQLTLRRRRALQESARRFTEAELDIHQALKKKVDVNFEGQPLSEVMDALSRMAGVNYYLDPEGMRAEGVTSNDPVTITLRKPVSLRSALNLILQPKRLSYIIQDEVLRITSEQERSGDVYTESYPVADLVIPIPNFVPSYNMGLAGAIHEAHMSQGAGLMGGRVTQSPLAIVAGSEGMGKAGANQSVLAQMGASGVLPGGSRSATPIGPGGLGGGPQADFDSLIELITTTVEPDTWDDVGGEGSIAPFETNLSLVVSQTQEVHEKIVDLLRQLRRLQDLQVTIEVRFITLTDNFFERIGVDFDFDIDDNTGLSVTQVNALDDDGPSVTVGLDPNGNFTTDLDLQFTQNTLGATAPIFGGFDPGSAANFGFAILSDIEAFFVIQAAQGDNRTNIMQAPKVTLFNGQQAFVSDSSQRPFVTSVIPVVGDFAAAHQPVITVLTEGTSLSVQAVVSPDRRFVRLTMVPFFSKIGDVDTFTFTGSTTSETGTATVDPTDDTSTIREDAIEVTEGTTVQLPTLAFTTVNTTVSVPDGGTILLGGIKRLAEGRTERGLPLMSKLPYVNRLFKNVGIGRETESLMMMVTPRIIIQEEEEERLGVDIPGT